MRLQYRDTGEKLKVGLWLDNSTKTEMKAYHCASCGYVVFTYYDDLKVMVAGEGPMEPSSKPIITTQCKNNQCKAQYDLYVGATNA